MCFQRVKAGEIKYIDRKHTFDTMEFSRGKKIYEGGRRKV